MLRRAASLCSLAACLLLAGAAVRAGEPAAPVVEVWKTASCGCCRAWVRHLEQAGFRVKVNEVADVTPVKQRLGVPARYSSCHTAVTGDGYVVEGHVPAADILRLLRERPKLRGILVPGMPVGSPGMEGPGAERYDVIALDPDGSTGVYASHGP